MVRIASRDLLRSTEPLRFSSPTGFLIQFKTGNCTGYDFSIFTGFDFSIFTVPGSRFNFSLGMGARVSGYRICISTLGNWVLWSCTYPGTGYDAYPDTLAALRNLGQYPDSSSFEKVKIVSEILCNLVRFSPPQCTLPNFGSPWIRFPRPAVVPVCSNVAHTEPCQLRVPWIRFLCRPVSRFVAWSREAGHL